jgi:hypothetical protein
MMCLQGSASVHGDRAISSQGDGRKLTGYGGGGSGKLRRGGKHGGKGFNDKGSFRPQPRPVPLPSPAPPSVSSPVKTPPAFRPSPCGSEDKFCCVRPYQCADGLECRTAPNCNGKACLASFVSKCFKVLSPPTPASAPSPAPPLPPCGGVNQACCGGVGCTYGLICTFGGVGGTCVASTPQAAPPPLLIGRG